MHTHPGFKSILVFVLLCLSHASFSQVVLTTPHVNSILFTGKGENQPLIVGLGGSEGGNAWASDYWKKTRDQFLEKGYAFLAIGYFGAPGTPDTLDRISIDAVHDAIIFASRSPKVDKNKIAIIGGSRGGDLALLLASLYPDINCVVAIVASHVSFPGNTSQLNTSSWRYQQTDLPFVPVNEPSLPFLMKGDLRKTFEAMLKDTAAEEKAGIQVERIHGPVLFLSARQDEICPSTSMADKMMQRLKNKNFKYNSRHVSFDGGHTAALKHFDVLFEFLDAQFPAR